MNEKVDIEIAKRRLTVEMEGMTELQILALAKDVSDRMEEVRSNNDKIVDSSKLAILTALEFAADLARVKDSHESAKRVAENKVGEITLLLQKSLAEADK